MPDGAPAEGPGPLRPRTITGVPGPDPGLGRLRLTRRPSTGAGQIIGATNADVGLKYLEDGISEAHGLSDGWFWFANLVEYAELSYRRGRQQRYLPRPREHPETPEPA